MYAAGLNLVWSREFTQTFISTACIEEHMDPCGFIYHTKLKSICKINKFSG